MADLYKTRNERELFSFDFSRDLDEGEEITDSTVKVFFQADSGRVDDVTVEFTPTVPAVDGAVVTFFLNPAATSEVQREGTYGIEVLAETTLGRKTAAMARGYVLPRLEVRAI